MGKLTADDVVTAVRRRYGCEGDNGIGPEWASLAEMDLQAGHSTRRIDLLLVRAWGGKPKGHERHAVEVKVSRADLRSELADESKWRAWWSVVHRFYLAVPASLNLDGLELPADWGVLTVTAGGTRQLRPAPRHEPDELPHGVTVEAFRRASRAEARIRDGQADSDPAATIARMEREVRAAERAAATAREAVRRAKERADAALQLYADVAPEVFCRCQVRIQVAKNPFGRGHGIRWEHVGEPGEDRYGPCRYAGPDLDRLAETLAAAAG